MKKITFVATIVAAFACTPTPAPAKKIEWQPALVSWYGLYGSPTACGGKRYVGQLGVAHKTLRCGTKVRLMKGKRKITVRVIDRGPYVGGREFDLTEETRNRLGCPDLCSIKWRLP